MSYCRKEGKDTIIFATEDYLSAPSTVELKPDNPDDIDKSNVGAILPNGEINWECPCLGNLPNGPCGPDFREAFSCWVDNREDESTFAEKCYENFVKWESCLSEHKDVYKSSNSSEDSTADVTLPDTLSASEDTKPSVEKDHDFAAVETTSPRAIGAPSVKK
uniref:Mitochondrial intermembrane space import and assembly protein 40-A-like n=1 Tax=Phallusia mammillata TaxID=59560 RepID=A0A6F9DK52_9ASCI|nr:mitochondrial intermembrane space import and assembly protein 40-A-like [Phallusia mammillata]